MSYVYTIYTKGEYGAIPVFTNEWNTDPDIPEGNYVVLKDADQTTKDTRRACVLFPITSSPKVMGNNNLMKEDLLPFVGKRIGGQYVKTGMVEGNPPVFMGHPVSRDRLPSNAVIVELPVKDILPELEYDTEISEHIRTGVLPSTIAFAVLIVIIVALSIALAGTLAGWWGKSEYAQTYEDYAKMMENYYALMAKIGEKTNDNEYDLNNDGIMDIRQVEYANGDLWQLQISDYGIAQYGVDPILIREGYTPDDIDPPEPPTPPLDWVTWLIVGIVVTGAVIVAVKVIPPLLKKEKKGGG